jgi:hypothetical protein
MNWQWCLVLSVGLVCVTLLILFGPPEVLPALGQLLGLFAMCGLILFLVWIVH